MPAQKPSIGKNIIKKIEDKRNSKLIVYFTGNRHPFQGQMAEDAVRPLYSHLEALVFNDGPKKIDLFLYSRGGDVSIPWRLASMIREFCDEFNVLIPYSAQSAATLLSLGADNIIMCKKAELGPIDPTLSRMTLGGKDSLLGEREISVEDVNSFILFVKDRANINDQNALSQIVDNLIKQIGPLAVGKVNRMNSHIRLVARKLLTSRTKKMDEEKIDSIIDTLTEKMYSHGHGIARKEARDIGLPVNEENISIEKLIWQLYLKYEARLKLNDPLFFEKELEHEENKKFENIETAIIESEKKLHIHKSDHYIEKERKIPPNPNININLNFSLPPGTDIAQLPGQAQAVLQQMLSEINSQISQIIQNEIRRQSPVVRVRPQFLGGKWHEEK